MEKIVIKVDNEAPWAFIGELVKSVVLTQKRPVYNSVSKYKYNLYKTVSEKYVLHVTDLYYNSTHDEVPILESSIAVVFTSSFTACKKLECSKRTLKAFKMLGLEVYKEIE